MALVVFLRGVNVGGHRSFRPSVLARDLAALDVVSVGATGTFVVRARVHRTALRTEFGRRLPFDTALTIAEGRDVLRLTSHNFFRGYRVHPDIIRFASVLSRVPRRAPQLPMQVPATGKWMVRILARERQFVVGLYRREMRVIGYLGSLDQLLGAPVTTRSWSTLQRIATLLRQ